MDPSSQDKTNCSLYYMEQSRLLLSEIAKFKSKQSRVFKHIDDAILHYRSSSDGEFHLLEREIFNLREKVILKGLLGKLNKSLTLLESELQDGVSDSDSGSDSGSLIRAEVVNPALAPRFLCFSSFVLSGPFSSVHPWYDSDWMIIVACGVIILGAAYFLRKRNDDGDDGHGGEPGSISGIPSSKGLLDLLPSQDASSSDSDTDFLWWDLREEIEVGRFAANPGNGESSVGLLTKVFAVFPYVFLHLILVCVSRWGARNSLFSLIYIGWLTFVSCALCCPSSTPKGSVVNKCNVRKYILLTLSHVESTPERGALTADVIIVRGLLSVKASWLVKRVILLVHLVIIIT